MTLSGKQTDALPESHHDYLGEPIDDETLALHVTGQLSNKTAEATNVVVPELHAEDTARAI
jgi:hypothetical protein